MHTEPVRRAHVYVCVCLFVNARVSPYIFLFKPYGFFFLFQRSDFMPLEISFLVVLFMCAPVTQQKLCTHFRVDDRHLKSY